MDLLTSQSSQQNSNLVNQLTSSLNVRSLRQILRITQSSLWPRHYRQLYQGIPPLQEPSANCVPSLMKRHPSLCLYIGQPLLFVTSSHPLRGILEVLLGNVGLLPASGQNSRLIAEIGYVCPTKTRGKISQSSSHFLNRSIGVYFERSQVHLEYLHSGLDIGEGHFHHSVKSAWASECGVKNVLPVSGSQDYDCLVTAEPVHFHQ